MSDQPEDFQRALHQCFEEQQRQIKADAEEVRARIPEWTFTVGATEPDDRHGLLSLRLDRGEVLDLLIDLLRVLRTMTPDDVEELTLWGTLDAWPERDEVE